MAQPKKDLGLIVVIGSGPVGIDFCKKLAVQTDSPILLYGDENYYPYNRIKLSLYLSGEVEHDDLYFDLENDPLFSGGQISLRLGLRVVEINRQEKYIVDELGDRQPYHKLILATGARSWVPSVPGLDTKGVYTFRDLKDADHLLARLGRSHHAVVVGAGLLGLEIAKGLSRHGTQVTVIDMNAWLLYRQLNEQAAERVQAFFESQNISILPNSLIKQIVTNDANRLCGFYLTKSKALFECDTLIFATGSRPNIDLAKQAGLAYREGIKVNGFLQTSDENIYAIGDCAEYQEQVQGIVSPGYEQASIAVNHLQGLPGEYVGSEFTTYLKVAGIDVFCAGSEEDLHRQGVVSHEYEDENGHYRCLMADNNRIVYVIAIGPYEEASRIAEAISAKRRFFSWQFTRFRNSGYFYSEEERSIALWPKNAIVCNCMSVTRGELSQAILGGSNTLETLKKETHACTVCGSCQPKIQELLAEEVGGEIKKEAISYAKSLQVFGVFAFVMALLSWLLPEIAPSNTSLSGAYDLIWLDGDYKQVTGFTLLGLSLIAMSLSISKRYVQSFKRVFTKMRLVHVVLGVLMLSALILHTGNSLGEGLNQWLMINFLLILLLGGLMSAWLSVEHKTSLSLAMKLRKSLGWLHILAVWILPVLLGFHVLSVYYF